MPNETEGLNQKKLYAYFSARDCFELLRMRSVRDFQAGPADQSAAMTSQAGYVYAKADGQEVLATTIQAEPDAKFAKSPDMVCLGEVVRYVRPGVFADIPKESGVSYPMAQDFIFSPTWEQEFKQPSLARFGSQRMDAQGPGSAGDQSQAGSGAPDIEGKLRARRAGEDGPAPGAHAGKPAP